MDFRKFDSYVILLAIVVVAGLLVSMVARFVILAKGADTGTANLVFVIVLGICAIFYLTIIAASSSVADFIIRVFTPRMARKKRLKAEAEPAEPVAEQSAPDIERIKQEADKRLAEQQREKVALFQRYGQLTVGPYITPDELARLGCYIDTYALNQPCPAELAPIHPQKLKNADLFHFGWNMAHYFGQPKQEVVPWLKTVFAPLDELEDSYIKGKLYSPQTRQFTIPNIDDIPGYMAEHGG